MARVAQRLPENVPGAFFVDDSCIDCDACRQIAPSTFARSRASGMSYVAAQPAAGDGEARALMAVVACPTASIGSSPKRPVGDAARAFPERIEDDVYYCGWHAEASYGAASYLVVRDRGNVLVDSPRAARPLYDRIDALGGVRTMVLSHRDDVADHAAFARRFGCERIMHAADAGRLPIERTISGSDPIALDDELTLIPVPGHTRGSVALLYREKFFVHGRSPVVGRRRRAARHGPRRLLVRLARAGSFARKITRLPLRMGPTGSRPSLARALRRRHAARNRAHALEYFAPLIVPAEDAHAADGCHRALDRLRRLVPAPSSVSSQMRPTPFDPCAPSFIKTVLPPTVAAAV